MINNKIYNYVNRAQLAINDWQCSGEIYYLEQAKAELAEAVLLADELAKEKPVFFNIAQRCRAALFLAICAILRRKPWKIFAPTLLWVIWL